MDLTITNPGNGDITGLYEDPLDEPFSNTALITATLVEPLFGPHTVISDDGVDLDAEAMTTIIDRYIYENANVASVSTSLRRVFDAVTHEVPENSTVPFNELFAIRAAHREHLVDPHPTQAVYTPADDIIPAAQARNQDAFFASLAYAYGPDTLGMGFANEAAFNEFKEWMTAQRNRVLNNAPTNTKLLFDSFLKKVDLSDLTESLRIRKNPYDNVGIGSFARLIVQLVMDFIKHKNQVNPRQTNVFLMPFTLYSLFTPESLVLVNMEAHANASVSSVNSAWNKIVDSIKVHYPVISLKEITQLTEAIASQDRSMQRMANLDREFKKKDAERASYTSFRDVAPKPLEIAAEVKARVMQMGKLNKSMNVIKTKKTSFSRQNRRDPDNFNRPGKITTKQYLPDFHIYLDCSGSISQENYRDAVICMIGFAKKFNVDLYFNSFGTRVSESVRVPVRGRSINQIWQFIQNLPKSGGLTNFDAVWEYILESPHRTREFSLMITDFGFYAPQERVAHPPRLHYAPCSNMDWGSLQCWAKSFADSMVHIDNKVARNFIGMH